MLLTYILGRLCSTSNVMSYDAFEVETHKTVMYFVFMCKLFVLRVQRVLTLSGM